MSSPDAPSGPVQGLRVLELGGKGPVPFAGMMLADMGASVTVCERPGRQHVLEGVDVLSRGKRRLEVDLKSSRQREAVLATADSVDVVMEGFRPGTAERLGLGPDVLLDSNPRLVYARLSGYGQGNSYSRVAGHDINFVAMGSALAHIGPADRPPTIPLSLVGDFGGGGMFLLSGVLAALYERDRSGRGQVVDVAMTDAVTVLMSSIYGMNAGRQWRPERGTNLVDGGAPFYQCYETADGRFVSVGSIEPDQYAQLLRLCGLDTGDAALAGQHDRAQWPALHERLSEIFRGRTQEQLCTVFADADACFAPVLTMEDAPVHPHSCERGSFVELDGVVQPAPAPRFSRTPSAAGRVSTMRADVRDLRSGASWHGAG